MGTAPFSLLFLPHALEMCIVELSFPFFSVVVPPLPVVLSSVTSGSRPPMELASDSKIDRMESGFLVLTEDSDVTPPPSPGGAQKDNPDGKVESAGAPPLSEASSLADLEELSSEEEEVTPVPTEALRAKEEAVTVHAKEDDGKTKPVNAKEGDGQKKSVMLSAVMLGASGAGTSVASTAMSVGGGDAGVRGRDGVPATSTASTVEGHQRNLSSLFEWEGWWLFS